MSATTDNATSQAHAQASSIAAMVAALNVDYDRLEELRDELENLKSDYDDAVQESDEARDKVAEEIAAWNEENAEELAELEEAAGDCKDADHVRQRIQGDALDVAVRTDWYTPNSQEDNKPSEFTILLCTGGPAVRIMGELDEYMQPCRAWIEAQDWGTAWSHVYIGDGFEGGTLLEYCSQFYFGE